MLERLTKVKYLNLTADTWTRKELSASYLDIIAHCFDSERLELLRAMLCLK